MPIDITQPGDLHQTFRTARRPSFCVRLGTWLASFKPCRPLAKLCFVTSRRAKFEEVSVLLAGLPVVQADLLLPTLEKTDDLPLVAAYRVFKAFKKVQGPVLLEETSLDVGDGFPGRHFKDVVELGMGKKQFARLFEGKPAKMLSVFAYTADGQVAHIFKHAAHGTIAMPKVWIDGDGSDPMFLLDGYKVPLSHLSAKHFIYVRQFPIAELRTMLDHRRYAGVYELHVTVANHDENNPLRPSQRFVDRFRQACHELKVKPLHIRMAQPNQADQLQTAVYVVCPNGFTEAQEHIFQLSRDLLGKGFRIIRHRIEAMLHNRDSPKTDAEAALCIPGNYFELHAKLDETADGSRVRDLVAEWQGSLQLSMSYVGDRVFVNAKGYGMGAQRVLEEWHQLIQQLPYRVTKEVKPEYCVYDDDPTLDQSLIIQVVVPLAGEHPCPHVDLPTSVIVTS